MHFTTNNLFDVCYLIPGNTTWDVMSDLNLTSIIYFETKLRDLRRTYKIRETATGLVICPFLLHLFSIPVINRFGNLR